ncbi:MAG TPA: zinc-dependent alcohol dehydrogenase [Polyangiaceae bacterium]|jgi:threonine dehydrogenase-like Zn-dependent dehydrogenase|nr:zinc-dependent alcohol dehydrogenase [Polyangiaceae bacterium]
MKAIVFHGIGDISLDNVPEPVLRDPTDAIVRITTSAICGTDLHFVRGTVPNMQPGTILGHEGVGIVEEVGEGVRNFRKGERVVVPSTIGCGACSYCRAGYFAQCDRANPNGPSAGTAFYGGPKDNGPFDGMQAEFVRVPFANVGLVKLPGEIEEEDAIMLSDIFPTAYFGAKLAEIVPGDTVAVFGCGPVGQLAITSAFLLGAARVFAIDRIDSRLEMARAQGAEAIDFDAEDPIEVLHELTLGIGVDRAIDAVGVDACCAHSGPAAEKAKRERAKFEQDLDAIAPNSRRDGEQWVPGDAPSQVLSWAVDGLAKAGTLSVIGVYPTAAERFPIGKFMNRNLTMKSGNCNHRRYIPELIRLVRTGAVRPSQILTQCATFEDALDAYRAFDRREPGWTKVELKRAA